MQPQKQILTEKQKRFCNEYLIDLNATQAAIRAGYSEKTANEQAGRLLVNVSIQAYINQLKEERTTRLNMSADEVVRDIIEVKNRCMQAAPVTFMGRQVKDKDGSNLWKFDSMGALKALDMLMKHLGGYAADNKQQQSITTNNIGGFETAEAFAKHFKEMIGE